MALFIGKLNSVYHITIGKEVIKTTSDHPFFIAGHWLKVKDLQIGDSILTYKGTKIAISNIIIVPGKQKVYNFEVEDFHTYYVTGQNVLVHNSGPCDFEGVYQFPDNFVKGKTYNGQSKNVLKRLKQHEASGKKAKGSTANTKQVSGGKRVREHAEQGLIKDLGGLKGGKVSNLINPVRQN